MKINLILSFAAVLFITSFVHARLRQNQQTGVYYTEGESKKINKYLNKYVNNQEYHDLAQEYLERNYDFAETFAALNMIGTPAALRLRDDLILLVQEMRQNLQRMYQ